MTTDRATLLALAGTVRDWLAYHLVLNWPSRWTRRDQHLGGRIYWAALPHAGSWAYRDEVRALAQEAPSDG